MYSGFIHTPTISAKRIQAWATLPDRSSRSLILINNWDINWQAVYTFQNPVRLPRGTVVSMRISYDNTAGNPRNPHHPPEARAQRRIAAWMKWGHVWLQVVAPPGIDPLGAKPDPRLSLQEAVMMRRLEKYPADFTAHYNLGALWQARGNSAQALDQFRAALRIDPSNAVARNALASAFAISGHNPEAIREWRETVRLQPLYSTAHFNLARILASVDDAPGAIREYTTYLQQQPDDAQAPSQPRRCLYRSSPLS